MGDVGVYVEPVFKMSNEVLFVGWIGDRTILTTLNNL